MKGNLDSGKIAGKFWEIIFLHHPIDLQPKPKQPRLNIQIKITNLTNFNLTEKHFSKDVILPVTMQSYYILNFYEAHSQWWIFINIIIWALYKSILCIQIFFYECGYVIYSEYHHRHTKKR